jgi:predicted SprT family Zn-dependent metalloprotease
MNIQKAEMIAIDLMEFHGLELQGWHFEWMRAKGKLGMCNHWLKTIYLSTPITSLNDEAQVLNTILHEIAHALVGSTNGHNGVWRRKAVEIGCDGKRTGPIDYQRLAKWKYTANCGKVFYTNRRLQNLSNRYCRCCHGGLTLSINHDAKRI